MKIPFLHIFQKKVPTEYFLALLFRDEKIHAVVFEKIQERIQVVGDGKAGLSVSVERVSDEMLLDACDKAISLAEESLPENITTHKTVFGVKETWVEDTHITSNYLNRLKSISQQLDLKPIGFLVFPEAIAHLLQKEEGAPVSAILIEAGEKDATITLIRAGRIVDTKEITIAGDITTTVEEGLKQFENIEIFPSRILLLETADKAAEKKFLTHKWSKSLPFLHVPQITMLPSDFDTRAILFGTATQMGLDAIDLVKKPMQSQEGFFAEEEMKEEKKEQIGQEKEMTLENVPVAVEEVSAASSGNESPDEMQEVIGKDTSEYFGFVKDADVGKSAKDVHESHFGSNEEMENVTQVIPEEEREEELAGSAPGFATVGPIFFEGAKKVFAQAGRLIPRRATLSPMRNVWGAVAQNLPFGSNKLILLIPLILILALLYFLWTFFGVKAKVTLFLTPKVITKDATVSFTTNGSTDVSKNIIAATSATVVENGNVSGSATGKKDVGTPAKGKVTLTSTLTNPTKLDKGTGLIYNNLKYTLDNDVLVASSSGNAGDSVTVTDISVTASDIGTEYNLPSATVFTINSFNKSDLIAKNPSAFSGGTKKSITVVSQKDIDSLTSQLIDSLKDKAKSDLSSKADSDNVVLPDFTKTTPGNMTADKKVGDEAGSLSASGTVTFESLSYKKSDIQNYANSVMKGQLPSDLSLSQDGIQFDVKETTTKDGVSKVSLTLKASLIPNLDAKNLQKKIAGKSFAKARDILSNTPQFSDATFSLSPNLFFFGKNLPALSNNINLSVVAHE